VRLAEEKQRAEAVRLAEEKQRAEAARLAEEKQRAEAARLAEEKQRAKAARLAEEKQRAEAARLAEEKQRAEAARLAGAPQRRHQEEGGLQIEFFYQRDFLIWAREELRAQFGIDSSALSAAQAKEQLERSGYGIWWSLLLGYKVVRLAEEMKQRAEPARQAEEEKRQAEANRRVEATRWAWEEKRRGEGALAGATPWHSMPREAKATLIVVMGLFMGIWMLLVLAFSH
jgi:IgA-specific serine endopeptidase